MGMPIFWPGKFGQPPPNFWPSAALLPLRLFRTDLHDAILNVYCLHPSTSCYWSPQKLIIVFWEPCQLHNFVNYANIPLFFGGMSGLKTKF